MERYSRAENTSSFATVPPTSIDQIEPSIANARRLPSGCHDGHHGVLLAAGAK